MTILVVAVAFTTGLLAGCSSMTTSPLQDASSRAELTGNTAAQGTSTATLPDDAPPLGGDSGSPAGTPPPSAPAPAGNDATAVLARFSPGGVPVASLITSSTTLQSGKKGSLTLGRWQVDVPAGALAGDATITLGIPSLKSTGCEVTITPAELDPFGAPLTLTADCKGTSRSRLASYVILCYNPTTLVWEAVPGSTVDTRRKTTTVAIMHAGIYAVGPASIR